MRSFILSLLFAAPLAFAFDEPASRDYTPTAHEVVLGVAFIITIISICLKNFWRGKRFGKVIVFTMALSVMLSVAWVMVSQIFNNFPSPGITLMSLPIMGLSFLATGMAVGSRKYQFNIVAGANAVLLFLTPLFSWSV